MTASAEFWTKLAPRYAAKPVEDMDAYDQTLRRVRSWLPADADVLEFGCGTGTTALRLADAARHITATDYSEGMIEIANGKLEDGRTDNVTFLTASFDDADLPAESYDVVMAFSLLHLLPDLPGALDAMRARLRPGGLLITKTVCLGNRRWLFAPLIGAMRLVGKAPWVAMLTPEDVQNAIRTAGFEIVETGDYPAGSRAHFVVARKE